MAIPRGRQERDETSPVEDGVLQYWATYSVGGSGLGIGMHEPGAAAAAERLLLDRVLGHVEEIVANRVEDIARLLEQAQRSRRIAGVVEGHPEVIIPALVQV